MDKGDARRYHHGNLRRALLDAALACIARGGPQSFTMSELAREAGVSSGAPYRHFASRDAILEAIAEEALGLLEGENQAALAKAHPADPLGAYRALGIAHVRFAVAHPVHFRVLFSPEMIDVDAVAGLREANTVYDDSVRTLLAELQAGGVPAMSPEVAMLAAQASMHGLARLFVDGQMALSGVGPDEAEALAEAIQRAVGQGIWPRDDAGRLVPVGEREAPKAPTER